MFRTINRILHSNLIQSNHSCSNPLSKTMKGKRNNILLFNLIILKCFEILKMFCTHKVLAL